MTTAEITEKVKRYKPYFGNLGGVTVSGGEPLMQCEFVSELFKMLHEKGINTAYCSIKEVMQKPISYLRKNKDTTTRLKNLKAELKELKKFDPVKYTEEIIKKL